MPTHFMHNLLQKYKTNTKPLIVSFLFNNGFIRTTHTWNFILFLTTLPRELNNIGGEGVKNCKSPTRGPFASKRKRSPTLDLVGIYEYNWCQKRIFIFYRFQKD